MFTYCVVVFPWKILNILEGGNSNILEGLFASSATTEVGCSFSE